MALYVVDVRDPKVPGRRRFNVSRRAQFRDDIHARNFGNPFGRSYKREQYEEWVLAHHRDALIALGQTGATSEVELACWCHAKTRCHAHIVKALAEELTQG